MNSREIKPYQVQIMFDGLITEQALFQDFLLQDNPSSEAIDLAQQFNDLYHLFLNKFARLSQESSLSPSQETDIKALLDQLLAVRRKLEKL